MGSSELSPEPAVTALGRLLSGTEADGMAVRLEHGYTMTQALTVVAAARRAETEQLLEAAGLGAHHPATVPVLRGIAGARSVRTGIDPLWTMPGHLATSGQLTGSAVELVARARVSVTCSTYNFQKSSGMWQALHEAAHARGLAVRVYVDTAAADAGNGWSPSTAEIAAHLKPGVVLRTTAYAGTQVRNHAKLLVVDHRFLLVTSANFSVSAEQHNVELGLRVDSSGLAEVVERQLRDVEDVLYERVNA